MLTEEVLQSELRDYERSMSRANQEIKTLKAKLDVAIDIIMSLSVRKNGGDCPAAADWKTCGETISLCNYDSADCWRDLINKHAEERRGNK